jgi:uncharacterized protein (TIGR02145 family)
VNSRIQLFFIILSLLIFSCGNRADEHDNKSYKSVIIGTQEWTSENLNTSRFSNGDLIPEVKENSEWERLGKEGKPAWCYYLNRWNWGIGFGKLYNWYAVTDPRGLCPKGWHVPTHQEWTVLVKFLGDSVGTKIKGKEGWEISKGNNFSGFNAVRSEDRWSDGEFETLGIATFWSTTSHTENVGISVFMFDHRVDIIDTHYHYKGSGLSCRCIKD